MRFKLREVAREFSPTKGVQKCGRVALFREQPRIQLAPSGRAYFAGLFRCGSVWECPVCMQGIAMGRADELKRLLAEHRKRGGGDYLLTLTAAHDQGDRLKPLREAVARAWRGMFTGREGQDLRKRWGLAFIRGHDLTVGPSGWHPHLHVILLPNRPLHDCPNCRHTQDCRNGACGHHAGEGCEPACEVGQLARFVYGRWSRSLKAAGYRLPTREHGIDVRHCRVARYIAKLGLGDELAKPDFKRAHGGHRTPLQLLADIHAGVHTRRDFDAQRFQADVALWIEYAKGMKGARQLTYSKGLRARYELPEEQPSEQLLLEAFEPSAGVVVTTFDLEEWRTVVAKDVRLQLRLLRLAEEHPPDEAADRIRKALDEAQGLEAVPF